MCSTPLTSAGTAGILNIAGYRFVSLPDIAGLQQKLLHACSSRGLKGTILLSQEGINLFLAGQPASIHELLRILSEDPRFSGMETRQSWSAAQPFRKLLVKIKPEIIRMDHPAIRPAAGRAPSVNAATLKRWLDAGHDDDGRPVVTLDTRNDFETDVGTFQGAIDLRIGKFTEFPKALLARQDELQGKTVVSFCTGGIRCEKAAIFMREAGVEHVFQLEGGILKYFEDQGQAHFDGECFVFDERRAVDAALVPKVDVGALSDNHGARTVKSCGFK